MVSSRFAQLVSQNKSTWKFGLSVVAAGTTFKVMMTEAFFVACALSFGWPLTYIHLLFTGRVLQLFPWSYGGSHGSKASAGDRAFDKGKRFWV